MRFPLPASSQGSNIAWPYALANSAEPSWFPGAATTVADLLLGKVRGAARVDGAGALPPHTACQPAGRPLRAKARGGKSGLHGDTVPDNVRRGRPQGKCHRDQTAPGDRGKGEKVR